MTIKNIGISLSLKIIVFLFTFTGESVANDRVAILDDPIKSLQARISVIKKTTATLDIATYIYGNDEASSQTLLEIIKAADRGVHVRIIIDALNNHIPKEVTNFMLNKGIRIKIFNAFSLKKKLKNVIRMHAKILVSDRLRCIIGGRNIVNTYFYIGDQTNFKDREIYFNGRSGKDAGDKFEDLWYSALLDELVFDKVLTNEQNLKVINSYFNDLKTMPFLQDDKINAALKSMKYSNVSSLEITMDRPHSYKYTEKNTTRLILEKINATKSDILIESPYVILSEEIFTALLKSVHRGVKVQIITNSMMTSDSYLVLPVYYQERDYLINLGIDIYEFQGIDQYLHTKMFIFDHNEVVLGSYNLDRLSANINTEIFVSIKDSEVVKESIKYYNETLAQSIFAKVNPIKPAILEGKINLKSIKKYSVIKLLEYTLSPYLRDYL